MIQTLSMTSITKLQKKPILIPELHLIIFSKI